MKRVVALIAASLICASFLIVPASAATLDRSMSVSWNRGGNYFDATFDTPLYDSYTNNFFGNGPSNPVIGTKYYMSVDNVLSDTEFLYEGAVGLYFSWFFFANAHGTGDWGYQSPQYDGFYTNMYGQEGTIFNLEYDTFRPVTDLKYPSQGWTYKAQFLGTPESPISGLGLKRASSGAQCYFVHDSLPTGTNADKSTTFGLCVPSARIIGVESTAELDALENMADSIAAQSEILSAMYGDLISICNAIYERTGDMLEAQNLANQYFAQLIPILNIISSNTGDIASTTANIYTLLQNQFQLLISTINQESGEIQDAIEQAVNDLISYLDTVFQSAVGKLPSQNESTGELITDFESAESDLFNSVLEGFSSNIPEQPEFSSELIAAFALINTIFNSIWAKMGDFKFVYIFSLTLAIILLAIGRISKFAGAGSTRSGPKAPPGKGGNDGA